MFERLSVRKSGVALLWACSGAVTSLFLLGCSSPDTPAVRIPVAEVDAQVASRVALPRSIDHTRQSYDASCWLACAVMVEGYYGKTITEDELWEKVKSITHNDEKATMAATKRECLIALAQTGGSIEDLREWYQNILKGTGLDAGLKPFDLLMQQINAKKLTTSFNTLRKALSNAEPAVIVVKLDSTNEHAMVVTGIALDRNDNLVSVDLLNPALNSPGVMKLTGNELRAQLKSILTKSFAEDYFTAERAAFSVNQTKEQRNKENSWNLTDLIK